MKLCVVQIIMQNLKDIDCNSLRQKKMSMFNGDGNKTAKLDRPMNTGITSVFPQTLCSNILWD